MTRVPWHYMEAIEILRLVEQIFSWVNLERKKKKLFRPRDSLPSLWYDFSTTDFRMDEAVINFLKKKMR